MRRVVSLSGMPGGTEGLEGGAASGAAAVPSAAAAPSTAAFSSGDSVSITCCPIASTFSASAAFPASTAPVGEVGGCWDKKHLHVWTNAPWTL